MKLRENAPRMTDQTPSPGTQYLLPLIAMATLSLAMYWDVLFLPGDTVMTHHFGDTSLYFIRFRRFGFEQMANGNLALWNPHLFSGAPFLGGFQTALLYPPNVVYLLLPLSKAISADMALHVFLIGAFMFGWARSRELSPLGAFFAGTVLMFSQATFTRVFAGQLTLLATFAWVPLLFLAIDKIIDRRSPGWIFVGIFAVSMQILAGYPQFYFMTGIVAGAYAATRLVRAQDRMKVIAALVCIAVAPFFITAAQLWTGLYTIAEGVRSDRVSYDFATSFSLPPENLLTLLAPGLLGNMVSAPYWGRWILWDVGVFMGVSGLFCGALGVLHRRVKLRWLWVGAIVLLLLTVLGRYTPFYALLYEWVPGFDRFRAPGKFVFFLTMFSCLLAGTGIDYLEERRLVPRGLTLAPLVVGLILVLGAAWIWQASATDTSPNAWREVVDAMVNSSDWRGNIEEETYASSATFAMKSLLIGAATCAALSLLFWLTRRFTWAIGAIVALGLAEVFIVSRAGSAHFKVADIQRPKLDAFYAAHPGDYRVLDLMGYNHVMEPGALSLWGYDPVVLGRYAEFVAFTQGQTAEYLMLIQPQTYHPSMRMLRCRYIVHPEGFFSEKVEEVGNDLPHFVLLRDFAVEKDRDKVFAILGDAQFDPEKTVVLEQDPGVTMDPSLRGGTVTVTDSSTDHMNIDVELSSSAILLITDAYSAGWRAIPLPGSEQDKYDVIPGNYALMAIPLSSGTHHLRLEYAPWAFRWGKWVSVLSLAAYFGALAAFLTRRRLATLSHDKVA